MMQKHSISLIDPEHDPRWDKFVDKHSFGWLFHLSSWKKIIEQSFPHMKGFYFILENKQTKEIRAALPIYNVKSWLTGQKLISIPFATLSDPLVTEKNQLNQIIKKTLHLFGQNKVNRIEIRTSRTQELFANSNFERIIAFKQHVLPLNNEPEELLKKFHRSCVRGQIKKALKRSLELTEVKSIQELDDFYDLYLNNRKRIGLPPHPFRFIENIWKNLQQQQLVKIYFAEHQGIKVAGMLLFKYKDRVLIEYLNKNDDFTYLAPNHFLLWKAIQLAYQEGFKKFDFGRTSTLNHSLIDFKNRWATQMNDLPHFVFSPNQAILKKQKDQSKSYYFIKSVCKKIPNFTYQWIGHFCYRHLN